MTRRFDLRFQCEHCGRITTAETGFGRWLRRHQDLDSYVAGLSANDVDYVVHKYKTHLGREVQCIMLVEIKTMGAKMTEQQRDTFGVLYQFLNNGRGNIHKRAPTRVDSRPVKVKSQMTGRWVDVRAFGVHLLQFEKTGPHDSTWIRWNSREISEEQLVGLLRFDLDPRHLGPLDLRKHHASDDDQLSFFCADL